MNTVYIYVSVPLWQLVWINMLNINSISRGKCPLLCLPCPYGSASGHALVHSPGKFVLELFEQVRGLWQFRHC